MAVRRKLDVIEPEDECADPRHRMCAVTRAPKPIDGLIRFVEGPAGDIVPDLRNKLPGRGVWITAGQTSIAEACRTKAFQRSLKHPVAVSEGLPEQIDALLLKQALDALSFVNKAGALVLGFDRVTEAVESGQAVALLHASDASADGVRKLTNSARAAAHAAMELAETGKNIICFSNEQLSLALGRPNVVHAALLDGPASRNFIEQTGRLTRYRSG